MPGPVPVVTSVGSRHRSRDARRTQGLRLVAVRPEPARRPVEMCAPPVVGVIRSYSPTVAEPNPERVRPFADENDCSAYAYRGASFLSELERMFE